MCFINLKNTDQLNIKKIDNNITQKLKHIDGDNDQKFGCSYTFIYSYFVLKNQLKRIFSMDGMKLLFSWN